MNANELWDLVRPLLDGRVNIVAALHPVGASGGTLTLAVANGTIKRIVDDKHVGTIAEVLNDVGCGELTVEIVVDESVQAATPALPLVTRPEVVAVATGGTDFNDRYTLDNFLVADCNRFAHSAVMQAIGRPGRRNPLYIPAKSGLGKTHLMHAMGHKIREVSPRLNVRYTLTEKFVNDLRDALREKKTAEFRRTFQDVDVWMVDDFGFLVEVGGGGSCFEEEYFHIMNSMMLREKQVVIASEELPKDLGIVNDRLRSRLEAGILADLRAPDLETRIEILKMKAVQEGVDLPLEFLELVARKVEANIRVLEGALYTLCARATTPGEPPLTLERVDEITAAHTSAIDAKRVSLADIINYVAARFNCPVSDITGQKRSKDIAWPRQLAAYLAREMTDHSLADIGTYFGDRDHSTILYSYNKVSDMIGEDEQVLWLVNDMKAAIRA